MKNVCIYNKIIEFIDIYKLNEMAEMQRVFQRHLFGEKKTKWHFCLQSKPMFPYHYPIFQNLCDRKCKISCGLTYIIINRILLGVKNVILFCRDS